MPGLRPTDISISECRIRTVAQGSADWTRRDIPEVVDQYPESWMMGRLPAYGFYVRHADRVRLRNIEIIADKPDGRPAVVCDDVSDLILSGLEFSAVDRDVPVFDLRNTRRAFLTGMRAPATSNVFAQVSGAGSADIRLLGNWLESGQKAVSHVDGATEEATKIG